MASRGQGQGPFIPLSGRMPHTSKPQFLWGRVQNSCSPSLLGGRHACKAMPPGLVNSRCSMRQTQQGQGSEKRQHSEVKTLLTQVARDASKPRTRLAHPSHEL